MQKLLLILAVFSMVAGVAFSIGPSIYHASEFGLKFFDWSGTQRMELLKLYWRWYLFGIILQCLAFFLHYQSKK